MEYFWWLYLATRLDIILGTMHTLMFGSAMMLAAGSFISFLIGMDEGMKETWNYWSGFRKLLICLFLVGLIGNILVPSKKDAMFIVGGVGVIEGVKTIQGSEIAKKSVAIIEQWLSNNLEELKQKEKELKKQ